MLYMMLTLDRHLTQGLVQSQTRSGTLLRLLKTPERARQP